MLLESRANDGSEILIHVGLETVSLNGKGFRVAVNEGDKISGGQMIMEVDREYISINAKSTIIPIIITNSDGRNKKFTHGGEKCRTRKNGNHLRDLK
jgi:sugar PTS system EIIA component